MGGVSWRERAEFLMALVYEDLSRRGLSLSPGVEEIIQREIALTNEDLAEALNRVRDADPQTMANLRRYLQYKTEGHVRDL
jgi:hypothetical protein